MSTKLLYFHKSALSWDRERMDGKIALTWCHGLPEHHLISLFYFIWLYFLHLNYIFVLLLCLLHSFFSGLHSSLLKWLFSWRLLITSNALKGFLVLILQLLHMSQNFDFILRFREIIWCDRDYKITKWLNQDIDWHLSACKIQRSSFLLLIIVLSYIWYFNFPLCGEHLVLLVWNLFLLNFE